MAHSIKDGTGTSREAKVDLENRLETSTVQNSREEHEGADGNAYNINSGIISITGADSSALLYMKNTNDTYSLVITAIALGVGAGTASDIGVATIVSNPTAGTIISNALTPAVNQNRNTGSTKTLTATVYKGADGYTFTDGADAAYLFQGLSGRLFASFPFVLSPNKAIGVKYDPNLSSGSVNVYAALICYLAVSGV